MWALIPITLGSTMLLLLNLPSPPVSPGQTVYARSMLAHHDGLVTMLLKDGHTGPTELPVHPVFQNSGFWQSSLVGSQGGTVLLTWPAEPVDRTLFRISLDRVARSQSRHPYSLRVGTIQRQGNNAAILFGGLHLTGVPDNLPGGTPALGSLLP